MTLYVARYEDMNSLILDAVDLPTASRMAEDVTGEAPAIVVPLPPGVFVVEVNWPDDGPVPVDDPEFELDPEDFTYDAILAIDDADVDALRRGIAPTEEPPRPVPTVAEVGMCASEGEDDENIYQCELPDGHAGDHRNGPLTWSRTL